MHKKDIPKCELIGLHIEVVGSKNKSQEGLKGKIVDETRNTLVIESDGKTKRLLKSNIIFKCTMKQQEVRIDGILLVGRSEERLKK